MKTIGIIGYGRFGKLMVKILEDHLITVNHIDQYTSGIEVEVSDTLGSDVIIFAVPMRDLDSAVLQYLPFINKKTVVMDVCSLKMFSGDIFTKLLPENECIGLHPLFGPQSAPDCVAGQSIVLCNVSACDETVMRLTAFLHKVLKLQIFQCSAEVHDKQMATSQAITHFIGRIAEKMNIERIPLTTKSFDDLMDIVELVKGGSTELFEDMQKLNPFAEKIRAEFIEQTQKLDLYLRGLEES